MFYPTGRSARVLAVMAAMAVGTAACGSSSPDDEGAASNEGVASLGQESRGDSGDAAAGPDAPSDPDEAFKVYDKCLADAGFDFEVSFADDADSGIGIESSEDDFEGSDPQVETGEFEDFDIDTFEEASEKCEKHLANADQSFDLSPEQEAAATDLELRWTKCMTDEGVEVSLFDEDGPDGDLDVDADLDEIDPQTGADAFTDTDFDFEGFEEAAKKCEHLVAEFEEIFNEGVEE